MPIGATPPISVARALRKLGKVACEELELPNADRRLEKLFCRLPTAVLEVVAATPVELLDADEVVAVVELSEESCWMRDCKSPPPEW